MQIFSKLQRNGLDNVLIIFALILACLFNSSFVYAPWFIGIVFLCANFWIAIFYIALFSLVHGFNPLYFFSVYIFYKYFLAEKIRDYINVSYQDVVGIFYVYGLIFVYLLFFSKNINLLLILSFYNLAMDLVLVRVFRCVPK
jgi:hypothetical protein